MNLNQTPPEHMNPHANNGLHPSGSSAMPAPRTPASDVPHRRYPSLCDDGQPWFPLWGGKSDLAGNSRGFLEAGERRMGYVRLIAILVIVGIVAFLAAGR